MEGTSQIRGAARASVAVVVAAIVAGPLWHGGALGAEARAAGATGGLPRAVSVQPFDGENAEPLRREVTRLVRARGLRAVTSLPRVDDTAQYLPLARQHDLTAFVTGDLQTRKRGRVVVRQTITFAVWNGSTGSELGRWSVTAPPGRLRVAVARGFSKNLGRALAAATAPAPPAETPAAPAKAVESGDAQAATPDPALADLGKQVAENRRLVLSGQTSLNIVWTLLCGFLVMLMQAGFALIETGLTRAKNVAHTMGMNFLVYSVAIVGYWAVGFALQMGGVGAMSTFGGDATLSSEFVVTLFGKDFGFFGLRGFFLSPEVYTAPVATLFLFQMVFMDTTATIPTGAMAERWKFTSFVLFTLVIASITYPIFGNWVWGGGWLSQLGHHFQLGHGHVDFAGSSVVHLVGGVAALVGAKMLGPRIGKYDADGKALPMAGHNLAMVVLGSFILTFGWFGFNAGSTLSGTDTRIAIIASNTLLASAGGACSAYLFLKFRFGTLDLGMLCNGMLAGMVAITAPCAFVTAPAALFIGGVAGILVIVSAIFVENKLKIDDPASAISVHATNGAWGVLSVGLFADGRYGDGWNGVPGTVRGLFYGDPGQLVASIIGVVVCVVWTASVTYVALRLIDKLVGNRVSARDELAGLDVPEMGVEGYTSGNGSQTK